MLSTKSFNCRLSLKISIGFVFFARFWFVFIYSYDQETPLRYILWTLDPDRDSGQVRTQECKNLTWRLSIAGLKHADESSGIFRKNVVMQ